MDKPTADNILRQSRERYDAFADSFSQTRNYRRSDMESLFQNYIKSGDRVLDIGCGNGRFLPFFQEKAAIYTGIDNSQNLVAIAQKNYPQADFQTADALNLPFPEKTFDIVASLAVLHHIPSKEYQSRFFQEINRVLKDNGIAIITVWDLRPVKMIATRNWKRLANFLRFPFGIGDFYIPWQNQYQRYVHAFNLNELKRLATNNGFSIESSGILGRGDKEGNLYIIAKKLHNKP